MDYSTICEPCNAVVEHLAHLGADGRGVWKTLHQTRASWRAGLEKGCHFCTSIKRQLRDDQQEWMLSGSAEFYEQQSSQPFLTFCGERWSTGWDFFLSFQFSPEVALDWKKHALSTPYSLPELDGTRIWALSGKKFAKMNLTKPQSSSLWSEESWSHIEQWLGRCTSTHTACNAPSPGAQLPTRLVDVRPFGDPEHVKLILPQEDGNSGHYNTLSYSWSRLPNQMMLSRDNEATLRTGIQVHDLPKTFQEAIAVTKRMKINYIWIDSLCIIQKGVGHLEDWSRESGLMEPYFANAFCNISATVSGSSSHGIFRERDLSQLGFGRIQVPVVDESLVLFDESTFNPSDGNRAILARRAWVWQERLLAKRVLHFGTDQLAFECHEGMVSELHSCEQPCACPVGLLGMKNLDVESDEIRTHWHFIREQERGYQLWSIVMGHYSRSGLTKAEDKTVAIWSVAQKFRRMLNDEYILGLWGRDLERQLLWRSADWQYPPTAFKLAKPRDYKLPSWSWLAVDQRVKSFQYYPAKLMHGNTTYIHAKASRLLDDNSPTSEPWNHQFSLWLTAQFLPCVLEYDEKHKQMKLADGAQYIEPSSVNWTQRIAIDSVLEGIEKAGDRIAASFVLARSCVRRTESLKQDVQTLDFLLLQAVEDGSGRPKRIGMMQWTLPEGFVVNVRLNLQTAPLEAKIEQTMCIV